MIEHMQTKYVNQILIALVIGVVSLTSLSESAYAESCNATQVRTVRLGQRGTLVKNLQQCLISRGYSIPGGASGYYGTRTVSAIQKFYATEMNIQNWDGKSFGPRAVAGLKKPKPQIVSVAPSSNNGSLAAGLKRIGSADELQKYLELSNMSYGDGIGIGGRMNTTVMENAMPTVATSTATTVAQAKSADTGSFTPERVSTTNVQVAGIDEPDIVKTDGNTIYYSREQNYYYMPMVSKCAIGSECASFMPPSPIEQTTGVTAVNAFPLSNLGIASNSIPERGEMLLSRDKKTLIIQGYNKIVAYNVSNPTRPVKSWANDLTDNTQISTSRMIDDTMYLITQTYLDSGTPCPVVPMMHANVSITIPCGDIWAPKTPESSNTTYTVFKMNPNTGSIVDSVTYLGNSNTTTISMFEKNLYIAYRMPSNQDVVMLDFMKTEINDLLSGATQSRITEVMSLPISTQSKFSEIMTAMNADISKQSKNDRLKTETEFQNRMTAYMKRRVRDIDRTAIVRIPLSNLSIASTGSVAGHLLNQFAMDEHNENLRIATTVGETWDGSSLNEIIVLNSSLTELGSVTDLGLTERIYSVRFMGDKAYIVTFRQTDPFYVIDLSVPTKPKMVGELKIPGYSAYLEPISDSRVLGVGREGSQVKISLFDVSDPTKPTELAKYILAESWTEVESNHHAFMHDTKHSVFFIPGSSGGYVLSYADNKLSLKYTVATQQVKRALYIDDYLYIVAQNLITVIDENTWKEVKTLKLE